MARIRSIKPEFFDDYDLCQLKPLARLLFAGLWCWADREGRLQDEPSRIKKNVLGYDTCNVNALLNDLSKVGAIIRYEAQGRAYIQIRHFLKHQRPHAREVPSTYPPPPSYTPQVVTEHDLGDDRSAQKGREQIQKGAGQPPPLSTDQQRALRAWENQSPGSITPTVVNAIDGWLQDGIPVDWIEAACLEAGQNGGRKPVKYIDAILRRWREAGGVDTGPKPKPQPGVHTADEFAGFGRPNA